MSSALEKIRNQFFKSQNLALIFINLSWLFLDKIVRMGLGLAIILWIARYLGPEQFGMLNFSMAFVALFGPIAALGLQGTVVRELLLEPPASYEIVGTAMALQCLGGVVAYGMVVCGILLLRPNDILIISSAAILGSVFLFKGCEVTMYWFESQLLSKYIIYAQLTSALIFAMIKAILILQEVKMIYFAWAIAIEAQLAAVLMVIIFRKIGFDLSSIKVNLHRAKKLLMDSWPQLFSGIAVLIYMRIDQIMLGEMIGDKSVGIYSAALKISEVWYFAPIMIASSVFPAILRAREHSQELYYRRLQQFFDLMVLLSVGVALPVTFLAPIIIAVTFGVEYEASASILAIHIWSAIFVFLGVASGKWLLAENKQMYSLYRTVLGVAANVGLNFWLIPNYGALGAAWATLIAYTISGMLADAFLLNTRKIFFMKLRAFNIFGGLTRVYKFNG
jgi:O-antigen/teichoic acid export membrane protein